MSAADELEVAIRPYRIEDAPALLEAAMESVPEAYPFMPWCHPGLALEEMRTWIQTQVAAREARTAYEFVILSQDGQFLGGCGLSRIDPANRRANLGYWVRSSTRGRGIATAAVRHLVRWGFENTDLVRLEVLISTQNEGSLRVAEKSGAWREGILRKRLMLHGTSHDAVVFSFVRQVGMHGTMKDDAPLKPLHSESSLSQPKLASFRKMSTEILIASLQPGGPGALKVKPDGTMMEGHHRIYVLRERGVDVDALPREYLIGEMSGEG